MPTDFSPAQARPRPSFEQTYPFVDQVDRYLAPVEAVMLGLTLAFGMLAFALSHAFGQAVAWQAFALSFLISAKLMVIGAHLRADRGMPRLGTGTLAAGLYIGFSAVVTILIYLRFPFNVPAVDPLIMQIDALLFGYSWVDFTTAMAAMPVFAKLTGAAYTIAIAQFFAVILLLAAAARYTALHRMMAAAVTALLATVAIWWVLPSIGASAFATLPMGVEANLHLVHNEATGAQLREMAAHGNRIIAPDIMMGTIAFPSYHAVLLCLAVCFLHGTWAFWPMAALNIAILPAILAQGGQHLTGVLGGVFIFAIAWWVANRLVPRDESQDWSA